MDKLLGPQWNYFVISIFCFIRVAKTIKYKLKFWTLGPRKLLCYIGILFYQCFLITRVHCNRYQPEQIKYCILVSQHCWLGEHLIGSRRPILWYLNCPGLYNPPPPFLKFLNFEYNVLSLFAIKWNFIFQNVFCAYSSVQGKLRSLLWVYVLAWLFAFNCEWTNDVKLTWHGHWMLHPD